MIRLNKYIANCGVCSRRKADELISLEKVRLNGDIVKELGIQIDEEKDIITVNGKKLALEENKVYIMLNKPKGFITTSEDQFDRKKVIDLIKEEKRVFPVGRLDMDTEGLLLFTNDGEFANKLTHPKNEIEKVYVATIMGRIPEESIEKLRIGVEIEDYTTKGALVRVIPGNKLEIKISEGKNRQIKKMLENVGLHLLHLRRIQIGNLKLGELALGKYRYLTMSEVKKI